MNKCNYYKKLLSLINTGIKNLNLLKFFSKARVAQRLLQTNLWLNLTLYVTLCNIDIGS